MKSYVNDLGFSLLELLIVLTLIGLLTCLTLPSYHTPLLHAHRLEAQTALLDLASRMETYYAAHHTYQTTHITDVLPTQKTPEGRYLLSILQANDTTYTLQATALSEQDTLCHTLTLNSHGIQNEPFCWSS